MLTISFVGDISLGEHYFSFGHGPRTFAEKNYLFSGVEHIFNQSDYVVANLEGPISTVDCNEKNPESMVFRGNPDIIHQLKKANINILNIANNHILQHGERVFSNTLNLLEQDSINVIGKAGQDALIISKDNKEIALFGCSDVPDNIYPSQTHYQIFDDAHFLDKIKEAALTYDVIIYIHWGREDTHLPTERQLHIENTLKAIGVKYIIGHHPHIFYPVKMEDNFLCAYSLGDFVFDLPWDLKLLQSGILTIELANSISSNKTMITPILLKENGCLPVITGDSVLLSKSLFDLYSHSIAVTNLQYKKFIYLFLNIFKGNSRLKFSFFTAKVKSRLFRK